MTAFFDTSVLVAALYQDDLHHQPSLGRLVHYNPSIGYCGAHSLVEVYSTLTRMPGKRRVSSDLALLQVENIRARLSVIALTAEEYAVALEAAAALGITGGTAYDAMLAHCALKSGAETIYTWNLRHYAQCGPEVTSRLKTP